MTFPIKYTHAITICKRVMGVYFLFDKGILVYIGQSVHVGSRVANHAGTKEFDSATYIPVEISLIDEVEAFLIEYYKPKYNKGVGHRAFLHNPKTPERVKTVFPYAS